MSKYLNIDCCDACLYNAIYILSYLYIHTEHIYSISGQVLKPIKASIYMLGSLFKYYYTLFFFNIQSPGQGQIQSEYLKY